MPELCSTLLFIAVKTAIAVFTAITIIYGKPTFFKYRGQPLPLKDKP